MLLESDSFAKVRQLDNHVDKGYFMSVDVSTVRRVARLARLGVDEEKLPALAQEMSTILAFVDQLNAVDTQNVQAMTSGVDREIKRREDVVTAGNQVDDILSNAPLRDDDYFAVPKVIE